MLLKYLLTFLKARCSILFYTRRILSSPASIRWDSACLSVPNTLAYCLNELNQGILMGEVWLYHWPPVWLVWISLFGKKNVSSFTADSKPVQQEVNGTVTLPPLVFPGLIRLMNTATVSTRTPAFPNPCSKCSWVSVFYFFNQPKRN